nr:unnamed protein product [Callosobruchus analis]
MVAEGPKGLEQSSHRHNDDSSRPRLK